MGIPIGPYRVYKIDEAGPGLAMSRSIGDTEAHEIGITCDPITTVLDHKPDYDFFIVAGSDGVFDVMDNIDVVNFVEKYRHICKKDITKPLKQREVEPKNTCIAQLLAEEARYRWLTLVEEDDVTIDDISVVVIELQLTDVDVAYIENDEKKPKEFVKTKTTAQRDPLYGSMHNR